MTGRVIDMRWWRRAKRYDAPDKGRLYAADDELLAQRLRDLQLPAPSQSLRERQRETYSEWARSRGARNPWR